MTRAYQKTAISLLVAAVFSIGCAAGQRQVTAVKTTSLSMSRQGYLAGLQALREGDYVKAGEHLRKVARGPSYIVYTPLARLRLADSLMFEERFQEAAESYRAFTQSQLGDPNLHYASYRLAQATVKSMPADFFLMPPADRRDQRTVHSAIRVLKKFISRFPDSPFIVEALKLLDDMVAIASSFEMEVAHFYMTRDRPKGAVNRLRRLMEDLPSTAGREETRLALLEALGASGDEAGLVRECKAYRERFPTGRLLDDAENLCAIKTPHEDETAE